MITSIILTLLIAMVPVIELRGAIRQFAANPIFATARTKDF